jgi:hypothetical protein
MLRVACLGLIGTAGGLLLAPIAPVPHAWLALGAFFAAPLGWRWAARRLGPVNLLRPTLLFLAFLAVSRAAMNVLDVDPAVQYPYAVLVGATLSGALLLSQWPEAGHVGDWRWILASMAGLALGGLLSLAGPLAPLLALLAALAAWGIVRREPDPMRALDPVQWATPWSQGSRRSWPGFWLPLRAPGVPGYLLASWALYVPMADLERPYWPVARSSLLPWGYVVPELFSDPVRAFSSLATAPWVNGNVIQLGYVTVLLLLFAWPFEGHEGTLRTAALFFLATGVASILAGVFVYAAHGWQWPLSQVAVDTVWTGGSAGAFGLMGAMAARARNPWPLLAFFAFWELNVGWFFLKSYTPAFHSVALVVGFLAARYWIREPRIGTDPRAAPPPS